MKKLGIFIMLAVILTGCYDDFRTDYDYTTVAFSTAKGGLTAEGELGRTVVKGEGLKLDIGVYLAGVLENKTQRTVFYELDESLLDGTSYELMPEAYYALSNNNTFTIPTGEFIGRLTITLDSAKFLADPKAVDYHYAIPFRITGTSADSILSAQSTKILVIKYINRQEGYYDHVGTYKTYDQLGAEMKSGSFTNVIEATTVSPDSVETNGIMMMIGDGYYMRIKINPDNTVTFRKIPNPPVDNTPRNLSPSPTALSTDMCSSWETLEAVRDLHEPTSSTDKTGGAFGNWPSSNDWGYLEYDFARYYKIQQSDIYWFTDYGGLLLPDAVYIDYFDYETQTWKVVTNPVGYTTSLDKWNIMTFDPVITNKIRINFKNSTESVGVSEWKVWGVPSQVSPEQAPVASVIPNGTNIWDPETSTLNLNYKVSYEGETYYTTVSSTAVWRNRVRDGVNEWRR